MNALMITCYVLSLLTCNEKTQKNGTEIITCKLSTDSSYILTNDIRTVRVPVSGNNENFKFVQIQIGKIFNPRMHDLAFEVHFQQQKEDKKIFLGTFSLFPANNPGRFIVATQGLLKNDGYIFLSLLQPEEFKKRDTISVTVKSVELLKE